MPTPDIAGPSTLLQQLPLPVSPDVAIRTWEPLALRAVVIVVYLVFIFEFYRFVARRDTFKLRFRRYARGVVGRSVESVGNVVRVSLYVVEYLVVYPSSGTCSTCFSSSYSRRASTSKSSS